MQHQQTSPREAPAATPAALYDLIDPPGIRRSKKLAAAEKALYRWVLKEAAFEFDRFVPAPFDLVAADTGFAPSGIRTASKFLRDCGLMERDVKQGRGGYTYLKVFDWEPFARAEGTLRLVAGDGERTLPLDFGDEPIGLTVVTEAACGGQRGAGSGTKSAFQPAEECAFVPAASIVESKSAFCPGAKCALDSEGGAGTDPASVSDGTADCAAADENSLPALVSALKSGLATDRYETWLGPCRLLLGQRGELKILAPTEFAADFVRKNLLREINALLLAAGHRSGASIDVDPDPPAPVASAKAHFAKSAFQPGAKCAFDQGRKQDLPHFDNPPGYQSEEVKEGRAEHALRMEEDAGYRVMYRAVELYWRVGEFELLFPWIAIGAALAIEEGLLRADQVGKIADEQPCQFAKEVFAAMRAAEEELAKTGRAPASLTKQFVVRHAMGRRGIAWSRRYKTGIAGWPRSHP